jgi:transcriptional regulator with XRE-family HTH domain
MDMTPEQSFGEVLRDLRVAAGMSQETLAYESDLDRSFISMLERGLKSPSISTLFRLAKPLGTKPSIMLKQLEDKQQK